MGDVENYIKKRRERDSEYAADYDRGYEEFRTGLLLRELRLVGRMTQKEFAARLGIKTHAVSHMENHAGDVRLAMLIKIAETCGKRLRIVFE
jgi:DNA-binding XRE family transcriptional regulator